MLAGIASEAIPDERKTEINGDLARADILAAAGRPLDSMKEISKVVYSSSKMLNEK